MPTPPSKAVKPVPEGRQSLTPYLIVKNAAKAIEFYKNAFVAAERYRLTEPDGKIGHAEIQIGDSVLMLADEYLDIGALSPESVGGTSVTLHVYVVDVDRSVERASSAGATIVRAVEDESFGDRTGMIVDPFGHKWHLATRKEEVTPEEMQQRWSAMFR